MGAELEGTEGDGLGLSPLSGPDSVHGDSVDGDSVSTTDVVQSGRSPLLLLGGLVAIAAVVGLFLLRPQPDEELAEEESESPAEAEADPAQMLLGEATDLGLVIADAPWEDPSTTRLLVLDTGEVVELEGATGGTAGLVDGRLVVGGEYSPPVLVDLRQRSLPVEPLVEATDYAYGSDFAVWDTAEGLIWVLSSIGESEKVTARTADGQIVFAGELSPELGGFPFVDTYLDGRLEHGPDGGIYRDTGGGYERVGFGDLEASSAHAVLVTECDGLNDCPALWRDRQTWELLPYPPVPAADLGRVWVAPGGLLEIWAPSLRVIDIVSGDVVFEDPEDHSGFRTRLSPDGRWLIHAEEGNVALLDRASDTSWPISDEGWQRPLPKFAPAFGLVDLTDTAFAGS